MPQVKSAREETEKQYKQELERGKQEVEQVPHSSCTPACAVTTPPVALHANMCAGGILLRCVFCTRACVPA